MRPDAIVGVSQDSLKMWVNGLWSSNLVLVELLHIIDDGQDGNHSSRLWTECGRRTRQASLPHSAFGRSKWVRTLQGFDLLEGFPLGSSPSPVR